MGNRFEIKTERIRSASTELYQESREVRKIGQDVRDIVRQLGTMSMAGLNEVRSVLRRSAEEAELEGRYLEGLSEYTYRIGMTYGRTEEEVYRSGEKSNVRYPRHGVSAVSWNGKWFNPGILAVLR